MPKHRSAIPSSVRTRVEKEFNHRCAVCGSDNPHLHHIDEDPSNNDPMNLIPLCPNCHLTDQHNPTKTLDPKRLRLFREYKDPAILKSQFQPLFARLQFFDNINDNSDDDELESNAKELSDFVGALEMGSFYANKIRKLTQKPAYGFSVRLGDPTSERQYRLQHQEAQREYREQLQKVRIQIVELAVELLRFQKW